MPVHRLASKGAKKKASARPSVLTTTSRPPLNVGPTGGTKPPAVPAGGQTWGGEEAIGMRRATLRSKDGCAFYATRKHNSINAINQIWSMCARWPFAFLFLSTEEIYVLCFVNKHKAMRSPEIGIPFADHTSDSKREVSSVQLPVSKIRPRLD